MTAARLFPAQEIGSLPKPGWRVKALADRPVTAADVEDARAWAKRTGVPNDTLHPLVETLRKGSGFTGREKEAIIDAGAVFGIRYLESAGLDIVYDGEQRRSEMYQHPIERSDGFRFYGHVRSWDYKYYKRAGAVSEPRFREAYHLDELAFVSKHARADPKVPITGAFTLSDWSYNEHFLARKTDRSREARLEANRELTLAIARNVIRPNIEALVRAGAKRVQIDEPALTTKPAEVPFAVQAFNESVRGLTGRFSLHICFSDYAKLYPHVLDLRNCAEYALEYANRDSREPGTTAEKRPGYAQLSLLGEHGDPRDIGLGVLDVHSDFIEPPELVRDRILYAVDVLGDPKRVIVNPDCGLRTRSLEVAYAKLQNLVKGAELARAAL